jgi:DNA transposition AAA+ family ATPase
MSTTRHSNTDDPAHAPERNLSSARLRPITISLAVAAQAVRTYPKEAREACLWLANLAANSQRIQLCWQHRLLPDPLGTIGRIAEVELCAKLGLDRREVYAALTGHEDADLDKFCLAVKRLRADFEAALPPLVKTADSRLIAEAFQTAIDDHEIALVQGKTRHGKTEEAQRLWLQNLHDTVWLHCPVGDERAFLTEFARALGVGAGFSKKVGQIRQQIKTALGIGLVSRVVIDEAHKLWPKDVENAQPLRIEFVRELSDQLGVSFVLLSTDQFAAAMELAKEKNARYSPGQIAGRRYQFQLRDVHTDKEIRLIAALHAGSATDDALEALGTFARSEEGYLGIMVKAVRNARRLAGASATITAAHVASAIKQQQVSDRVKQLVTAMKASKPKKGQLKLLAA